MNAERYSVTQFFEDGQYEHVRRFVSAEEAAKAVDHYTHNVASRMGLVTRVIVTDALDQICFEWVYGKGVVFPPVETVN